jgi:N6-adenosine-specific RNA methylase IME4
MKKYNIIYADPPWSYKNKKTGGNHLSGAAQKYAVMTTDDICNMEIPVSKDCVLFLWATVPLMPDAFKVMEAWGFKYKTMLTWRKVMSLGMGFWFRGQTEHLLIGVKGKVKAFRMQVANFHQSKAEKHSKKPAHFRDLIAVAAGRSFTEVNKLELFAREQAEGWDVFGNEVENSIILPEKSRFKPT